MKKRNRKSRFTKTDVNALCEMQRKIDAYENFIIAICGVTQWKDKRTERFVLIRRGTDLDEWMDMAWKNIHQLLDAWNLHKDDVEDDAVDGKPYLKVEMPTEGKKNGNISITVNNLTYQYANVIKKVVRSWKEFKTKEV